jgi:N-acetylmuramoyl-L-alanine amidase
MRTLVSAIFLILLFLVTSGRAALVTDVRLWSAPDHSRVVLDLTGPVQYEGSVVENPPQYHLELKGAALFYKKRELAVNDDFLTKMSLAQPSKDNVKIVFYQKRPLNTSVFTLKPYLDKPHRLVIDLVDLAQEKKEQEERQKQKESRVRGAKIVVIDPGHGGEDPGAISFQKTMEKDVVLKVGRKVVQFLGKEKEVRPFLTRKSDYFIPLQDRVRIAREYGADLFVSLHADASQNRQARGSSVYCLSLSGATDQAAKILADKENMSNLLGGAFSRPSSASKDPNLNQILLDLMQNNSMKESLRFAEQLLEEVKPIHHLKYRTYRQANFLVLRAPDIPAALFEMAYITNKEDERLLNQDDFQEEMAKTIAASVMKFFND